MLRALFTSPEFAAAIGQKVRTPFEDLHALNGAMSALAELLDVALVTDDLRCCRAGMGGDIPRHGFRCRPWDHDGIRHVGLV